MEITHESLIGTYEQKRALVAQFNLMHDTFFSVVLRDKAASEYLLTALLGRPIRIVENFTQYAVRNIESHSIVLDALIEDDEKKLYNIEIQVEDKENDARRIRYYTAAIDWSFLKKGADYNTLPELYMIFISRYDNLGGGKNHYEIEQHIKGTDTVFDDGIHKLLFNTAVDDGTELSKLLQYLENSDPNNNSFGALSKAVNYHKINNEGVDSMCKAVEEYANKKFFEGRVEGKIEGKIETVKNLLKKNISLDTALECAELDFQTYKKYENLIQ